MRPTATIFLPCELFQVEILSKQGQALTELECLVLKAIHQGADEVSKLSDLFCLGTRVTLDLILDLWNHSYLLVDFVRNKLVLPKEVEDRIAGDRLKELKGTQSPETMQLLIERVSGQVLRPRRNKSPTRPEYVAPALMAIGRASEAPRAQVLEVVEDDLSRRSRGGDVAQVAELRLSELTSVADGTDAGQRVMEVEAEIWWDESAQLRFRLRPTPGLHSQARRSIEQKLEQYAEDNPDHRFMRRMAEIATLVEGPEGIELTEAWERLDQQWIDVEGLDSDQLGSSGELLRSHEELALRAETLSYEIQHRHHASSEIELTRGEAVMDLLHRELGDAQNLVVLACTGLRYHRLKGLLPSLEAALRRGVHISLIWGGHGKAVLETATKTALDGLSSEYPGLRWSSESSRNNSGFLYLDGARLVLISGDPLGRRDDEGLDLAVTLIGHYVMKSDSPHAQLLDWSVQRTANYRDGETLRTIYAGLMGGHPDEEAVCLPSPPADPLLGGRSVEGEEVEGVENIPPEAIALWKRDWSQYRSAMNELCQEAPAGLRLVFDGAHRSWRLHLLKEAERFVILSSDRTSKTVLDDQLLRVVTGKIEANKAFRVLILTGQIVGKELKQVLTELSQKYHGQLHLYTGSNHLKAMVTERGALVTSFSLLSEEGYYSPLTRFRQRSELGVLFRDSQTVSALVELLAEALPDQQTFLRALPALIPGSERRRTSPRVVQDYSAALQALVVQLGGDHPPDRTRRFLKHWYDEVGPSQAWLDLELLWSLRSGWSGSESDEGLAQVASYALLRCVEDLSGEAAQRWIHRLAQEAWGACRFQEALEFAERGLALETCEGLPSIEVIRMAACLEAGESLAALALPDPAGDLAPTELRAVELMTSFGLLFYGDLYAWGWLEGLERQGLSSPLLEMVRAVLDYWREAGEPIPTGRLVARSEVRYLTERLEPRRMAIEMALERAESMFQTFALGRVSWPHLIGKDGPFEPLLTSLEERDWGAAREWRDKMTKGTLGQILDDVCDRACKPGQTNRLITRPKRRTCLSRLDAVLQAVNDWVEAGEATDATGPAYVAGKAEALGERLRSLDIRTEWGRLGEAPSLLPLVKVFRDSMEPLLSPEVKP